MMEIERSYLPEISFLQLLAACCAIVVVVVVARAAVVATSFCQQQCYSLSMSIGNNGGTAVTNSAAVMAAPVRWRCLPLAPFVPSALLASCLLSINRSKYRYIRGVYFTWYAF